MISEDLDAGKSWLASFLLMKLSTPARTLSCWETHRIYFSPRPLECRQQSTPCCRATVHSWVPTGACRRKVRLE